MRVILLLVLACSAVHARPVTKARKTEAAGTPQQEVTLLLFGIVQFGQALKYVRETTEAKVKRIGQTLQRQEEALQTLGTRTERAAEVESGMREALRRVQAQMAEQQAQTRMTKDRLAGAEQEEAELRTKVRRLEMHVNSAAAGGVRELQGRAKKHSSVLRGLQERIQLQRESIISQDEQLRRLRRRMKCSSSTAGINVKDTVTRSRLIVGQS